MTDTNLHFIVVHEDPVQHNNTPCVFYAIEFPQPLLYQMAQSMFLAEKTALLAFFVRSLAQASSPVPPTSRHCEVFSIMKPW
jgi:hypothetical protein